MSEELNLADIQRIAKRATEPTLRSFVTSLSAEIARLRAALGSRGVPQQAPLPPSLQASIDLFRENPEAWHEEWSRKHAFKVKLLKENAALRGVGTPQEQEQDWYVVYCDGKPQIAYPRRVQAEVYATGFAKPCEIRTLTKIPDLYPVGTPHQEEKAP